MRFTYDYDRAEFIRAQRAAVRHAESRFLARGPIVIGGLALCAAIAAALVSHDGWANILARLVPWLLIIALWLAMFSRMVGFMAARQHEKLQDSRHPTVAVLDESGHEVTSFSGTVRRHWSAIGRVVETEEFLLLYFTKQFAVFLPKRAIPANELPSVRGLLREKLGDRAELMDAE